MTAIRASYFDGKTSRKHAVSLSVQNGTAMLDGDVGGSWPIAELRVSERLRNGARKVTFPDGAYLEVIDRDAFNLLLAETGFRDSPVVRMQQSWRGVLSALAVTLAIVALGYVYGIPAISKWAAHAVPENVERRIGKESLEFLDKHAFAPSVLPQARRDAIVKRFRSLAPPQQNAPDYEIVFRKSKIGPNAFALPSGQIVVTDEIVTLMNDDEAVMGILGHELGHLHERHLMRRIIQSSLIGAVATVLFGDVSAVVANIPTLLLDMKYSRDAEREADDYAVALFKANGIKLDRLAHVFEKLGEKLGEKPGDKSANPMSYLSSHPPSEERVRRILAAP